MLRPESWKLACTSCTLSIAVAATLRRVSMAQKFAVASGNVEVSTTQQIFSGEHLGADTWLVAGTRVNWGFRVEVKSVAGLAALVVSLADRGGTLYIQPDEPRRARNTTPR